MLWLFSSTHCNCRKSLFLKLSYINLQKDNFQVALYGQKNYDSTTMKKTLWLHYGEILLNQKLNYLDNLIQHIKMVWNTHFQKFIYFHIQRKNLFSMQTKNTLINRLSTSKIIRNTLFQKFIYICLHTWKQFPFNFLHWTPSFNHLIIDFSIGHIRTEGN